MIQELGAGQGPPCGLREGGVIIAARGGRRRGGVAHGRESGGEGDGRVWVPSAEGGVDK